jgi:hypothetical protein
MFPGDSIKAEAVKVRYQIYGEQAKDRAKHTEDRCPLW